MHKEICKRFFFLFFVFILVPTIIFCEKPKTGKNPQTAPAIKSTQLRIEVTGGKDSTPVKGATVYVEWNEEEQTMHKEGTTNKKGIVGPYSVRTDKVFIQITSNDRKWEFNGGNYDLKGSEQTITINLKKKPSE